jgi:hypothetical protein
MPPHQVRGRMEVLCPFAINPYRYNFVILKSLREQHLGLLLSLPQSVEAIWKRLRNEQKHNFNTRSFISSYGIGIWILSIQFIGNLLIAKAIENYT